MSSGIALDEKGAFRLPAGETLLTSLNNPTIKIIRSLRLRKERERTGLFFVEGIRFVAAALQQRADIVALVVTPEHQQSARGQEFLMGLRRSRPPNLLVTPEVMRSLADREEAQGISAVMRQRWETLETVLPARKGVWVALDGIEYPGNLGTILRGCDAVGCEGVILIGDTSDPYDPQSVRASMGAIFYQRLIRADFRAFADWKARHRLTVVGTSPGAQTDYRQIAYPTPVVLYMGSEGKGLPLERQALCDAIARIPMVGQCDSLNVAITTCVMLYEVFHQAHREGSEGHKHEC
jgi:TrmH family RNA methyltransferase